MKRKRFFVLAFVFVSGWSGFNVYFNGTDEVTLRSQNVVALASEISVTTVDNTGPGKSIDCGKNKKKAWHCMSETKESCSQKTCAAAN
jgi:hypothetical protein